MGVVLGISGKIGRVAAENQWSFDEKKWKIWQSFNGEMENLVEFQRKNGKFGGVSAKINGKFGRVSANNSDGILVKIRAE